jgi:hypothetical protein
MRTLAAVAVLLCALQGCERVDKKEPEPDAPMAVVFVMEGKALWIGNTSYEMDPQAQYTGALKTLEVAVDKLDLSRRLPPGSRVGIVTYADRATVRLPLSPVAAVHGSSFGTERDYAGQNGNDLVQGIAAGVGEVARSTAPVRLVIVLCDGITGDGSDAAAAAAQGPFKELSERATRMNIPIKAVFYLSPDPGSSPVVLGDAMMVNSQDGFVQAIGNYLDKYAPRAARD